MLYERLVGLRSELVRNLVERGAVRRFAEAIDDPSPLYVDEGAAARNRYGRIVALPTFPRTFDYGRIEGLELPPAGLIHGEFRIAYERPLLVDEELLRRMELKASYDEQSCRGLLGLLAFERTGEVLQGESVFAANDIVVVTEALRRGIEV